MIYATIVLYTLLSQFILQGNAFSRYSSIVRLPTATRPTSSDSAIRPTVPKPLNHKNEKKYRDNLALFAIKGPVRYSSNDWFECLTSLPTSRILAKTKYHTIFFTLWAAMLTGLYKIYGYKMALPATIHSILGAALSLLLVFRTNSSYDRFWEGRKLWSNVVMASRDIARFAYLHLNKDMHKRIAQLLIVYMISLKQHLQGERVDSEITPFIEDDTELKKVQTVKNRPSYILRTLSVDIHKALHSQHVGSHALEAVLHEHQFEHALHMLGSALAGCERIVKQPVPLAYSRHTSRFLSLYMATLPLALISSLGWATIPVVALMNWSFVSIMEIGHFIEEPFNKEYQIIPLSQLVTVVRADVSELLDDVVSSPELERFDQKLLQSAKGLARMRDDSYFAYY